MDLDNLVTTAKALGLDPRYSSNRDSVGFEVPADSGNFIMGKATKDGAAFALLGGVDVSDEHGMIFSRTGHALARQAISDIVSYVSLFDIEYEFEYFENVPKAINLVTRWRPSTSVDGLMASITLLVRAKQGVLHRIQYWVATIERSNSNEAASRSVSDPNTETVPSAP